MIDGDYMLELFHEQDEILHPEDEGSLEDFTARFNGYVRNLGIDHGSIEQAIAMYWNENVVTETRAGEASMSPGEYAVGMASRWFILGVLAGRDRAKDPRGG